MKLLKIESYFMLPDDFTGTIEEASTLMFSYTKQINPINDFTYDFSKTMYENWWNFVNSVPDAKIIIDASISKLDEDSNWLCEKDIFSLKDTTQF
jgi:hypothetical protein